MFANCKMIPTVIKDGKEVDSILFKQLLKITDNRADAVDIYNKVFHEDFKKLFPYIKLDENSEPELGSLLSHIDFGGRINQSKLLKFIETQMPLTVNSTFPNTTDGRVEAMSTITKLNEDLLKNSSYVAYLEDKNANEVKVSYAIGDSENRLKALELMASAYLNTKMRDILSKNGISVGTLTAYEKRLGVSGVTDFSCNLKFAKDTLEMIRIANNIQGDKALSEEFSHAMIKGMLDNPLIPRLIALLKDIDVAYDILGEDLNFYMELYKGNMDLIAEELAGKLLSEALINNTISELPLLSRLNSNLKEQFKNVESSEISNAVLNARAIASLVAHSILNPSNTIKISPKTMLDNSRLYFKATLTKKFASKEEEIAQKALNQARLDADTLRRTKLGSKAEIKNAYTLAKEILNDILKQMDKKAIYEYLTKAADSIALNAKKLENIMNDNTHNWLEKANFLSVLRNQIKGNLQLLISIQQLIRKDAKLSNDFLAVSGNADNPSYTSKAAELLALAKDANDDMFAEYYTTAVAVYTKAMEPYITPNMLKGPEWGKDANKPLTKEEILFHAKNDLGSINTWILTMAECGVIPLQLIDKVYKDALEKKRLRFIETRNKILALALEAEKHFGSYDWMYFKYKDGLASKYYIQEYDEPLYWRDRKAYKESLANLDSITRLQKMTDWENANHENGKLHHKYLSKAWLEMQKDPHKKHFFELYMALKKEMDSLLPVDSAKDNQIIFVRKALLERLKEAVKSKDKSLGLESYKALKDAILVTGDDTDFGEHALNDLGSSLLDRIPIFFTHLSKNESIDDISKDPISTMLAYSNMALNYDEMSKVRGVLELGLDFITNSEAVDADGNRIFTIEKTSDSILSSVIKSAEDKIFNKNKNKKAEDSNNPDDASVRRMVKSEESNIAKRLKAFFNMQVYQKYMGEGEVGEVSYSKLANLLMQYTGLRDLALSVTNGLSNVATGNSMMHIEMFLNKHFGAADVFKGDAFYAKHFPAYAANIGSRTKNDTLSLLDDMFNITLEYEKAATSLEWSERHRLTRLAGMESAMVLMNAGEHWMAFRTFLAYALRIKVSDGKTTKGLLDCLKSVTMMEELDRKIAKATRENNLSLVAELKAEKEKHPEYANTDVKKLVLEDGFKIVTNNADGTVSYSDFNLEQISKIAMAVKNINHSMHGVYNKEDSLAILQFALGRLAVLYRKWMKPAWDKRFAPIKYSWERDETTEGYYHCAARLLGMAAACAIGIDKTWKEYKLHSEEKRMLRACMAEIGLFIAICGIVGFMDLPEDWEDDLYLSLLNYLAYRLRTELGMLVPLPWYYGNKIVLSPMLNEAINITKNPFIATRSVEAYMNFINVLNPKFYEEFAGEDGLIQRGVLKGHDKAFKIWLEFIPGANGVYRGVFNTSESYKFYK